ncbi:MAG: hypothetical protein AMJ53_07425 [Gammaproteobacteria bacterium SG8_11]|nr:MAG: hypothetical protein AMJ53_07425 [Gammaproteobacteria bacterium SG8_11]
MLLVVLLFLIISWTIQKQLSANVRNELGDSLNTVLHTTHRALVTWLDMHESATLAWANSSNVVDAVTSLLDGKSAESGRNLQIPVSNLQQWFHSIESSKSYEAFLIAAEDNRILASSMDLTAQWHSLLTKQAEFVDQLWSGKAVVSLPIVSNVTTEHTINQYVGAPIHNARGQIIALLIFQLNPHMAFNQILQLGQLGGSGETYLFNQQGIMISRSRYEHQLQEIGLLEPGETSVLAVKLSDPGVNLLKTTRKPQTDRPMTVMAASALSGVSGMDLTGYRDYRGVMVVGAWVWDDEHGLGIATEQDAEEAYAVLTESLIIISSLTLLAITLLLGLARFYIENRRRRHAEQAFRTSQERFEAQFRGVPVPTYTWQRQGDNFRLVDYNNAAESFTEGGIVRLKGKTATELFKEQRPDILEDINNCFFKKTNIHKNYWYKIISTGVDRYLAVTYAYIPHDLVLIHTNDITERKLAEENLQNAHSVLEQRVAQRTFELQKANADLIQEIDRRRLAEDALRTERDKAQLCIDNVSAIIVGLDKEGNITLINQPACRILEQTEQELIGKNWFEECLPADQKEDVLRVFKKVMQGKTEGIEYYENMIASKSGRQRLVAWKNSYLIDANSQIVSGLSVGEDITERRQAEEFIRERQAEMAHVARVTTMGEMATGLAHELNQPLTAINVYAGSCLQQLKTGKEDNTKLQTALERISHQAQRAANIIQNLRQFLSKGVSQRKPTDLNNLIRQTSEIALLDAGKTNINIHYELQEVVPLVSVDPIQIEQVIVNLLRNSMDAITNMPKRNRHLYIRTETTGEHEVKASIRDNGPGITTTDTEKLFHPFYSDKAGGMGMGLAISRSIVEAHEGRLSAVNNPEGGATFSFTLPIEQSEHD